MNSIQAVDPVDTKTRAQAASAAAPAAAKSVAKGTFARAARLRMAVPAGPAATVSLPTVPASVSAEDRALYLRTLKATGNAAAALAAVQAQDASEKKG